MVFWYEIPLSSEFFDKLCVALRFLDDWINTEGTMGKMVVTEDFRADQLRVGRKQKLLSSEESGQSTRKESLP